MKTSQTATILHLSDLHFGKNLNDTGESHKASAVGLFKKRRVEMQAHNAVIVTVMPTEIKLAARALGVTNESFDFYVVTGDVVTSAGSDERYDFAHKFLTDKVPLTDKYSTGLSLPTDRVLCVPGNHDVLFDETPKQYLRAFELLPEAPPYVRCLRANNGQQFVFYGIDSNGYGEGNFGVGKISLDTIGWLDEQFSKIDQVEDETNTTVRILMLHHHPADLNQFRKRSILSLSRFYDRFTILENGDQLLDLCKGRMDLIMHGHEHFPIAFQDDRSGCVIVSAGTTSEWQPDAGQSNNFHALVFCQKALSVFRFDWIGNRFRKANTDYRRFTLARASN